MMHCDDLEIEIPTRRFDELDSALHELGMLATCTNSRQEYLQELQNRPIVNMLAMNTKYVSNVSIGFKVRRVARHVRYKPYTATKHEERLEERHRTRSENNDTNETATSLVRAVLDENIEKTLNDLTQLKKAKSLESIVAESNKSVDLKNIAVGPDDQLEIEVVSDCIQNLKVAE